MAYHYGQYPHPIIPLSFVPIPPEPSLIQRHPSSHPQLSEKRLRYPMLEHSQVCINQESIPPPVMLPLNYEDVEPFEFSHNFGLALEVLSQIEQERIAEENNQRILKNLRLEEAWRAIEEKRQRSMQSSPKENRITNPETLVDLDFGEEELKRKEKKPQTIASLNNNNRGSATSNIPAISQPSPQVAQSPPRVGPSLPQPPTSKKQKFASHEMEQNFSALMEIGMNPELSLIAIEALGKSDLHNLIQFISDFEKLQERGERFPHERIKRGLVLYKDYDKALHFLQVSDRLLKRGATDQLISEGMELCNSDLKQMSEFVLGYLHLKEFGFSDTLMKEALLLSGNNLEKAIQVCLEKAKH